MSAPPYQKFFWGAYHKHTAHLRGAKEHGAYLLLIGALWNNEGRLSADDDTLAAHAQVSLKEWRAMKSKLLGPTMLRIVRGKLVQPRVSDDLAKFKNISGKRKVAGKSGGEASASIKRENRQAIATVLPTKSESESYEEVNTSSFGETPSKAKSRRKPETPVPDGFPDTEAKDAARNRAASEGVELNVPTEAERFRNHALQTDRRARDWRSAWRNWIVIAVGRAPKTAKLGDAALVDGPKFPNAAIRDAVVAEKGEPWAISYIDRCRYEDRAGVKTILAPSERVWRLLREHVPTLERRGARIVVEPIQDGGSVVPFAARGAA